ncbi:Gfo/Idh/MocA family protein [Vulcaniibacterium tengchongense]|uniref:Putative dehydrogenase n=1 Tax=Vulcaniibacterium tengchongense TaxID=1273429 RepID=A0A3N4VRY2_9GAMM|nr:Gfo/Idh/MocA family oxidoreductase [Vulcaniibacterium tengchongense]RPE81961.1 putative dehydrogenase [Vulcaniibacterium tengchongense]
MADRSRRRFLAETAAVLAAAPFVSTRATRARAQASRKLGFALCGLGRLSTDQLAPALAKTKYCRLAGIVTGTPAKAEAWKARYGIPAAHVYSYETMHRMADNPDIDVVYVVTPNGLHGEHAIAAAQAGKHVFCEKPMEISVERCQRMIQACRGAGRLLGIAYRCRFEPHHLECIRLARERVFGRPLIVQAGFGIKVGDDAGWRLRRELAGGGALMDVGIYALQATRYLTGEEPVLVSAVETRTDPAKFAEVDESLVWTTRFPSGVVAYCSTSYNAGGIQNMRVNAERGWFELDPAFFYGGLRGRRSDGQEIRFPRIDMFAAEMDDFARCILEGRPTRVPGEEGLRDVRIMQAIYESARTGRAVSLA